MVRAARLRSLPVQRPGLVNNETGGQVAGTLDNVTLNILGTTASVTVTHQANSVTINAQGQNYFITADWTAYNGNTACGGVVEPLPGSGVVYHKFGRLAHVTLGIGGSNRNLTTAACNGGNVSRYAINLSAFLGATAMTPARPVWTQIPVDVYLPGEPTPFRSNVYMFIIYDTTVRLVLQLDAKFETSYPADTVFNFIVDASVLDDFSNVVVVGWLVYAQF